MESQIRNKSIKTSTGTVVLIFIALAVGYGMHAYVASLSPAPAEQGTQDTTGTGASPHGSKKENNTTRQKTSEAGMRRFSSDEEFSQYFVNGKMGFLYGVGLKGFHGGAEIRSPIMSISSGIPEAPTASLREETPTRVSQTNVQVPGIDEPDVVKTNGREIFYAARSFSYWPIETDMRLPSKEVIEPAVHIVKAFPPQQLAEEGRIQKRADALLVAGNILVAFDHEGVRGYDISQPSSPEEKWHFSYSTKRYSRKQAARLKDGVLYLVVAEDLRSGYPHPCPLMPLSVGERPLVIPCTDVYRPAFQVDVDAVYHFFAIDAATGKVIRTTSLVASDRWNSVVYVAPSAIYFTYRVPAKVVNVVEGMLEEMGDAVPPEVLARVRRLESYDLSTAAKQVELGTILGNWMASLDEDEQTKLESDMVNAARRYAETHIEQFGATHIVKIRLSDFEIAAEGEVPGNLLNQFSLDEYEGNLRVATTIGGSRSQLLPPEALTSESRVYVLDGSLRKIGEVGDLGISERIYAVRFVGPRGYVVTFRRIDPFYVIDLSSPRAPKLAGELKIPGFSSYLHPISRTRVLGIGKEGARVKVSLFDVANPTAPRELSTYVLDAYWSDIQRTHHAFLLDDQQKVFFLPAGGNGFLFSYQGDTLQLARAVSRIAAERALYLNSFFYIVGERKLVVLEKQQGGKWKEIASLSWQ